MNPLEQLKRLLGGNEAPQRQKMVNKQAARPRMSLPAIPAERQPMAYAQKRPMMNTYGGQSVTPTPMDTPANRFYPNNTNYGVPEDNMIDTSMGYLSPDQFNQGFRGQLQSRGFDPQQDYRNRLRVR